MCVSICIVNNLMYMILVRQVKFTRYYTTSKFTLIKSWFSNAQPQFDVIASQFILILPYSCYLCNIYNNCKSYYCHGIHIIKILVSVVVPLSIARLAYYYTIVVPREYYSCGIRTMYDARAFGKIIAFSHTTTLESYCNHTSTFEYICLLNNIHGL